jgi:hypothetical protein
VDGLDIALEGVSGGRDADMLTIAENRREAGAVGAVALAIEAADELAAIVGLPDEVA